MFFGPGWRWSGAVWVRGGPGGVAEIEPQSGRWPKEANIGEQHKLAKRELTKRGHSQKRVYPKEGIARLVHCGTLPLPDRIQGASQVTKTIRCSRHMSITSSLKLARSAEAT